MMTNHIAPSFAAGAALHRALSATGTDCKVLANIDDLSHGPIDARSLRRHASGWLFSDVTAGEAHSRHIAWTAAHGRWDPQFIDVDSPTVFWFGRRSAEELCSLLNFASAAAGRPWSFIDVTESNDFGSVASTSPAELELLVDTHVAIDETRSAELVDRWRILQRENAPFRVLSGCTVSSVSEDYFDGLLLENTPNSPTPMSRVIAETMSRAQSDRVADYVLMGRLIALVSEGAISAEGNPSTMESCLLYRDGA